jgi:histone demethylase JARID1
MDQRALRTRFSDESLLDILRRVEQRANAPENWRNKLIKLLATSARPPLDSLTTLLAEGEQIDYNIPELSMVRKCVARARKWMDAANVYLESKAPPTNNRYRLQDRNITNITALLDEVANLGFDSPAIAALGKIRERAEQCRVKARDLVKRVGTDGRDTHLAECSKFLQDIAALPVWFEEFGDVQKIVGGRQLSQEIRTALANPAPMDLRQVQDFLERAAAHNFTAGDDAQIAILKDKETAGRRWGEEAVQLCNSVKKRNAVIEHLKQADIRQLSVDAQLTAKLQAIEALAMDMERRAKIWLHDQPNSDKPTLDQVADIVKTYQQHFTLTRDNYMYELDKARGYASDLEMRCEEVANFTHRHTSDRDFFDELDKWRDYARRRLGGFALPKFDKLEASCQLHRSWVKTLPWYNTQLGRVDDKHLLIDVIEATRSEDDTPSGDVTQTCVCWDPVIAPPAGQINDAVQCDNCQARFHGGCTLNSSCPFCDQRHWDGTEKSKRPWHFAYLQTILLSAPEISKQYSLVWRNLNVIVHRVDRLVNVIGQFLILAQQPSHQRYEYIPTVRHFMRKLIKMQFVVAPHADRSFGLELAGLHRILVALPPPQPARICRKRKRPKFQFGQDADINWDDGTRCICRGRTDYLRNYPTVECEICSRLYHANCVFFPLDPAKSSINQGNRFICPLCCVRKGRTYVHADIRVKDPSEFNSSLNPLVRSLTHNAAVKDSETFVNTIEMLDTFSKDMIYTKLPPPVTKTLFIELVRFTPGQPDFSMPSLPLMSRQSIPPSSTSYRDTFNYGGTRRYGVDAAGMAPGPWSARRRWNDHESSANGHYTHSSGPVRTEAVYQAQALHHRNSAQPQHHLEEPYRQSSAASMAVHATGEPPTQSSYTSLKRKFPGDQITSDEPIAAGPSSSRGPLTAFRMQTQPARQLHSPSPSETSSRSIDDHLPRVQQHSRSTRPRVSSTDQRQYENGSAVASRSVGERPVAGRTWSVDSGNPESAYM